MTYKACYRCRFCHAVVSDDNVSYTEEEVKNISHNLQYQYGKRFHPIASPSMEYMHSCDGEDVHDLDPGHVYQGYMEFVGFLGIREEEAGLETEAEDSGEHEE